MDTEQASNLIMGQKLMIASCIWYLTLGLLSIVVKPIYVWLGFGMMILIAIVGMQKVIQASDFSRGKTFFLYLSIVLPPFGLISFAYLSQVASQELKSLGDRVGVFGVKR